MAVAVTPFLESLQLVFFAGVDGEEGVAVGAHHDEAALVGVVVCVILVVDRGDGTQHLQVRIPWKESPKLLHLFQKTVDVFPVATRLDLDRDGGGVVVQEHVHLHPVIGVGGFAAHVLVFAVHVVAGLFEHVNGRGTHQPFDDVARGGAESRGKFLDFFVGLPGQPPVFLPVPVFFFTVLCQLSVKFLLIFPHGLSEFLKAFDLLPYGFAHLAVLMQVVFPALLADFFHFFECLALLISECAC